MNTVEQGIASYLGEETLAKLQQVRIGIAGAGGLGSNCAAHLVRSGFKKLVLVDFDTVEPSNLNRQFYFAHQVGTPKVEALAENLRSINPDVELEIHKLRVERGNIVELFGDCDTVVEAFDAAICKKQLVEAIVPTGKLLVSASGMGGLGRADAITTRKLRDNFIIIGDMVTECSEATPPLSPMVGVCAAKQADVVLAYFVDK